MSQTKEEKRRILLQAASDVLLEFGPQKTTLDDIAKRAGMAKTSLYYYFKDKNAIIKEIIRHDMEQLLEKMSRAADAAQTAEKKMYALTEARFWFISEKAKHASKESINEFRSMAGIFESERDQYLKAQKDLIQKILQEGIDRKELQPIKDIDLVSLIMISSMLGLDLIFAFYDQRERVLEGMKSMTKIFFAGLRV